MDYKKEIAEMLTGIRSEKILRYIWIIVSDICKDLGTKTDEQQNGIIEFYIDLCYITGRCVGNHAPLLYTTI